MSIHTDTTVRFVEAEKRSYSEYDESHVRRARQRTEESVQDIQSLGRKILVSCFNSNPTYQQIADNLARQLCALPYKTRNALTKRLREPISAAERHFLLTMQEVMINVYNYEMRDPKEWEIESRCPKKGPFSF